MQLTLHIPGVMTHRSPLPQSDKELKPLRNGTKYEMGGTGESRDSISSLFVNQKRLSLSPVLVSVCLLDLKLQELLTGRRAGAQETPFLLSRDPTQGRQPPSSWGTRAGLAQAAVIGWLSAAVWAAISQPRSRAYRVGTVGPAVPLACF